MKGIEVPVQAAFHGLFSEGARMIAAFVSGASES